MSGDRMSEGATGFLNILAAHPVEVTRMTERFLASKAGRLSDCPECGSTFIQTDGPGRPKIYDKTTCGQAARDQRKKERA